MLKALWIYSHKSHYHLPTYFCLCLQCSYCILLHLPIYIKHKEFSDCITQYGCCTCMEAIYNLMNELYIYAQKRKWWKLSIFVLLVRWHKYLPLWKYLRSMYHSMPVCVWWDIFILLQLSCMNCRKLYWRDNVYVCTWINSELTYCVGENIHAIKLQVKACAGMW